MDTKRISEITARLAELANESARLTAELKQLQEQNLPVVQDVANEIVDQPLFSRDSTSPDEKTRLFLELFSCRTSVYPRLWENTKQGTKGYAPACRNEWIRGVCEKPRVKCSACPNQAFLPLDSQAARRHLLGHESIGTYAINEDDTCTFLAVDFDGTNWQQDVSSYREAARSLGIEAAIERSRSGNGGHAWIFFETPIEARVARQLGTLILSRASANTGSLTLSSYDRFFPNQDSLPKGGFGNLIALPLQRKAREKGNSVFLDDEMQPLRSQWAYLASMKRLSAVEVRTILEQAGIHGDSQFLTPDYEILLAEKTLDAGSQAIQKKFTGTVRMVLGARLAIELVGLPSFLVAAFKRTATFANPRFFELQRLRFSTWNTPRFIFCGELAGQHLFLPRGTLDACQAICRMAEAVIELQDTRADLPAREFEFHGTLTSEQEKAVGAFAVCEQGVLVASAGFGKTVMGCAIIAHRKVPTLVLVHRSPLVEQWREQIARFIGMERKKIGVWGGQRRKLTGDIDIAMVQSLTRLEDAESFFAAYGQVIIDECHHIPAVSFESLLQCCPARYVVGLTATPYRKDGLQAILHMQCGPTRYEMKEDGAKTIEKRVVVRETAFSMPSDWQPNSPIHEVWEAMITDPERLKVIATDICSVLQERRCPLVISERKEHLQLLRQTIREVAPDLEATEFILTGGMGKRAHAAALKDIQSALASGSNLYILATGSFVGEGFDLPALDTLILAMPVSFKGKIVQYAGRIERPYSSKSDAIIYEYLDSLSPLAISMFRKRASAYRALGYGIEMPGPCKVKIAHKLKQRRSISSS